MALYDSASLLDIFNRKAGRPATDSVSDDSKYQRLSESQQRLVAEIAAICPRSLYPKVSYASIPTLSSVDGQVFTFGTTAAGYPIFPMGHGGIYASLADIPDKPWIDGVDFLNEGTQIRIPSNGSYSGTLYWYGVEQPPDITAGSQPSIFPEAARELIVIDAVRQFATEYARQPDLAAAMAGEWGTAWPTWCLAWKTTYRSGGALQITRSGNGSNSGAGAITGGTGGGGTGTPAANDGYWTSDYFG